MLIRAVTADNKSKVAGWKSNSAAMRGTCWQNFNIQKNSCNSQDVQISYALLCWMKNVYSYKQPCVQHFKIMVQFGGKKRSFNWRQQSNHDSTDHISTVLHHVKLIYTAPLIQPPHKCASITVMIFYRYRPTGLFMCASTFSNTTSKPLEHWFYTTLSRTFVFNNEWGHFKQWMELL